MLASYQSLLSLLFFSKFSVLVESSTASCNILPETVTVVNPLASPNLTPLSIKPSEVPFRSWRFEIRHRSTSLSSLQVTLIRSRFLASFTTTTYRQVLWFSYIWISALITFLIAATWTFPFLLSSTLDVSTI
ncbi:hypothetical protein N657DRAFT_161706 [Parathielavia appendiculata]|uniref:Uncharacterized protein n=1 Tax=Parathielavia appendiculata TaxID=2587402 RepID=A0AAN6TUJ5_9PEZI|nr:hypothetical protein N657DRAFT_161706 [Parathielavia appendiculata]